MVRLISRQRGGLAALKLTKLFGIDDFPATKDSGKVLIIIVIIYCYLIIIIIIIFSLDSLLFVSHILFPLPWSTKGCGCHGWTSVARMLSRASVSRVSNFRIVFGTIRLIIE